jgi:hypothetical protein
MLRNTVLYRMDSRGRPHAAHYLGEGAVQPAQTALKGSLTFAVLLCRGLPVNVRRKMRERDLLREQQQEDTGQMQEEALHDAYITAGSNAAPTM